MLNRQFTLAAAMLLGATLASGTLLSCQPLSSPATSTQPATTSAAANISDLTPQQLRDFLADMADSHHDKIQLSWWVSTLRPVDPPFQPFYENMGKQNKSLLAELKTWANEHHIDLTYRLTPDLEGRARKIMDDRSEKLVRSDNKIDFQQDNLMQMYNDYEWNLSQIQAVMPSIKDAALKAYLEKSLKMYTDGSAEIRTLLRRYKFQ